MARSAAALTRPGRPAQILQRGAACREKSEQLIADFVADAFEVILLGQKTLAINAGSVFANEVGSKLALRTGTFGIVFRIEATSIRVSLRGANGFNVSQLALQFGGGGHAAASAFSPELDQLAEFLQGRLSATVPQLAQDH